MSIIAKETGGTFQAHPEGQFPAVCVDVHDLGIIEVTWKGETKYQAKIDIYFYAGETKETDANVPLLVRQRFTLSLSEKGRLRPFLESWRGKKFTPDELRNGFDVERLIGAPAFLQVAHVDVGDKTYANIATIMRLPQGMTAPPIPASYVRVKDRPKDNAQPAPQPAQQPARAAQPVATAAPAHAGGHTEPWPNDGDAPTARADYDDSNLPF